MSFLWDSVKQAAGMAGQAAVAGGTMAKLKAELVLVDREVTARQEKFGIELYDYVEPLSRSQEFFAANDRMTETIRGPLLTAQREIAALNIRRGKFKEQLSQAEVKRKSAFPNAATTVGEKVINAAKAARFAGNEAKIHTDVSVTETIMKSHKQEFGVKIYSIFVEMEDKENWLPTVREIRSLYDQARRDIEKLQEKMASKKKELEALGGEFSSHSAQTKTDNREDDSSRLAPAHFMQSVSSVTSSATPTLMQSAVSQTPQQSSVQVSYSPSASSMTPSSYSDQPPAIPSVLQASNDPPSSSTSTTYSPPVPNNSFGQPTSTRGQELFAGIVPQTNTKMQSNQENYYQTSTNSTIQQNMNSQNGLDPFSSTPALKMNTRNGLDPFSSNHTLKPTMNTQNGLDPFSSDPPFKSAANAAEYDPFSVFDNLSDKK
eukprot:CAMPEP_0194209398 /NCGR_PEP_ID=MMETSP0156-20130528/7537_1 /TAXON_ID=33649 /ORGANISM="Thalassionema nitzschioides, Strain L26-B" /LENGTH=431 /DNA_ID=CAMNT_0038936565 /DNA_START=74 /DNA_END=1369 /DNA_ORIENTATION=-